LAVVLIRALPDALRSLMEKGEFAADAKDTINFRELVERINVLEAKRENKSVANDVASAGDDPHHPRQDGRTSGHRFTTYLKSR